MAKIKAKLERVRELAASPEDVFSLLADVPDSVSHFPDVASLEEEAGGYRWTMKPTSVAGIRAQTIYGCRYHMDREGLEIRWEPLAGVGNALVHGTWKIAADGPGTRLELATQFEIELDLPLLLRGPAKPFVKGELGRLLDQYLENLATTLGGGDGRLRPVG